MASSRRSIAARRSRPGRQPAAHRRGQTGRGGRGQAGWKWLSYAAAAGAGALGIAVAGAIGAGELMAGGVLAYMAYRMTRDRVAPSRALIEGVQFGQGQPPKQAPA